MSRAKKYTHGNEDYWFNVDGHTRAKVSHLELLSDIERIDLDDILEENLSQKEVLRRLHVVGNLIPQDVLDRRRERLERSRLEPKCRICAAHGWICEGRITRHHFVPRWLMRELDHYQRYAARSKCTVPICLLRHRELHTRYGSESKSIVEYLTAEERRLAEQMLIELKEQRLPIFELLTAGEPEFSYEAQLILDFTKGRFREVPSNNICDEKNMEHYTGGTKAISNAV